jgi:hypothetical protein
MRDSCTKCKALSVAGGAPSCKLGHPINSKTTTPAEPCERPLTYLAFNEAHADYIHAVNMRRGSKLT